MKWLSFRSRCYHIWKLTFRKLYFGEVEEYSVKTDDWILYNVFFSLVWMFLPNLNFKIRLVYRRSYWILLFKSYLLHFLFIKTKLAPFHCNGRFPLLEQTTITVKKIGPFILFLFHQVKQCSSFSITLELCVLFLVDLLDLQFFHRHDYHWHLQKYILWGGTFLHRYI